MKLKKVLFILLVALMSVGCASDNTEAEAKKQKEKEDAQVEELYTEIMSPGFSLGAFETDFKFDKNFKLVRKLVVEDYKTLNDEQTAIEDMYSEFYNAMGENSSFLNEGPDFIDLKTKAAAVVTRIDQAKLDATAYVDAKAIKERAKAMKLDAKYQKVYIELVSSESGIQTRADSMSEKLDSIRKYASLSKDALDFLTAHQAAWVNNNGVLTFNDAEVYQEYNKIVEELGK